MIDFGKAMWQIISLKIVITHSTVISYLGIYSMEIGFPIVREILFTKSKALLISYKKVYLMKTQTMIANTLLGH